MRMTRILHLSTAVAMVAVASSPAWAQETDHQTAPKSETADQGSGGLGEIVVTAQRRSENLQKAAIAVTAVTSDSLARAGVTDITQITSTAPQLQVSSIGGASTQLYLRGVGNFTTNSLSDAAVAVNIDGVVIARSSALQGLFFDLDRVEVLKGPQGTLYGRNATGGAINLISTKPQLGQLSGYVTAEYGNFNTIKVNAAVNLPAGENGAFRIAGYVANHDGYMSDGTGDGKVGGIRVQAKSKLTDTFTLAVGGDYEHAGGSGSGVTFVGLNFDDRAGRYDPRSTALLAQTFAFPAFTTLTNAFPPQYQNNSFGGAYAQADIDTSLGTLTILPAYRMADIDFLTCTAQCFITKLKNSQFTFETRLASPSTGRFNYLVGLFYMDELNHERDNFNQQYNAFYTNFDSATKSYAGFVRLGYNVTDYFRLTAGGRYTIDEKAADIDSFGGVTICNSLLPGGDGQTPCFGTPTLPLQLRVPEFIENGAAPGGGIPIPGGNLIFPYGFTGAGVLASHSTINPNKTFEKFTYRLGFEFDAAPRSLIYGSYETGFKAGGFFASIDDNSFKPETIDAWTLGSKNRFLDDHLQLNVEAFWWTYKDQQVSHFRTNSLGGVEFVTENVGRTRLRGIEVETVARVAHGTTLNATIQYLDAKNLNFTYTSPASQGLPVTGCPYTPTGATFTTDCSGRRPINAPEWTLSGGLEQVIELASSRFVFNANGRYQSDAYVGFEQLPGQLQKGYFIGDLQLKYEMDDPQVYIAGYVNNVTDQNVSAFTNPAPSTGGALLAASLRPPRTYGVRVGYKF